MNDLFQKFFSSVRLLLRKGAGGAYGARRIFYPERDWNIVLFLAAGLFFSLLFFGVYLFWGILREGDSAKLAEPSSHQISVDRQLLQKTLDAYKAKQARLEAFSRGVSVPFPPDPSR